MSKKKTTTKGKATAAKRPPTTRGEKQPARLSCLDAAAQVLKGASAPMNCKAMVDAMAAKKLWTSDAPTPAATLSSAILREMTTKKAEARFKKTGRGLFTFNG